MKLSDNAIAQIVRLLQFGMLTGTDVSDNLRMLELSASPADQLDLDPDYLVTFEKNLAKLAADADTQFSKNSGFHVSKGFN